jgi:hypothetical protein
VTQGAPSGPYTHDKSPRGEEKGKKKYSESPKFDGRCESTNLRSPINVK